MLYVGHQRIQSRCHTPLQVVTGYLLGIICALSLYLYRC
jgi:membrane-associated phospholipid phosphatase